MSDLEALAADASRRERAAATLDKRYPKIAACIRAGMRSSTWTEDLIDPGLLLDLLEAEDARTAATASDAVPVAWERRCTVETGWEKISQSFYDSIVREQSEGRRKNIELRVLFSSPPPTQPGWDAAIEAVAAQEIAKLNEAIDAAYADEALSETGRDRIVSDCRVAKAAVHSMARALRPAVGERDTGAEGGEARCQRCGHVRKEHSYNGACYGLCGESIATPPRQDAGVGEEEIALLVGSYPTHTDDRGDEGSVLHDAFSGDHDERTEQVYALARAILNLIHGGGR